MISQAHVEAYSAGRSNWSDAPHFVLHGAVVKSCRCGRVKLLQDFPRFGNDWDGLGKRCNACETMHTPEGAASLHGAGES